MFLKVAQIVATSVYTYINLFFQNSPKSHQSVLATFTSKFDAKNFQKSPNLVTLERERVCMVFVDKIEIGRKKCV